jgi:PTS system mannose-specific IID component
MVSRADLTTSFLRSFAIQGSWNYETLLGGGMGYALAPLLARVHAGNPVEFREAVRRHASSFNGHPYLCTLAVGALARLEHDGADPETIERFRTALRGPLGAIGDRLIWAAWRPLCLLLAITFFSLGLAAWKAALLFLIVYNAGHLWLRVWGFRTGWREGLGVGSILAGLPLKRFSTFLAPVNLVLLGTAVTLLVGRVPQLAGVGPLGWGVAVVAAVGAYLSPSRAGAGAIALLGLAALAWPW